MSPRALARPKRPAKKPRTPQARPSAVLQQRINKMMSLVDVILDGIKTIEEHVAALDRDHTAMLEALKAQMGAAMAFAARIEDLEARVGAPSQGSSADGGQDQEVT